MFCKKFRVTNIIVDKTTFDVEIIVLIKLFSIKCSFTYWYELRLTKAGSNDEQGDLMACCTLYFLLLYNEQVINTYMNIIK